MTDKLLTTFWVNKQLTFCVLYFYDINSFSFWVFDRRQKVRFIVWISVATTYVMFLTWTSIDCKWINLLLMNIFFPFLKSEKMIAIFNISSLTEINFIEILFHQFMSIWFWAAFWTKISTNQEHMKYSEFSFFFFHQTKFLFAFTHDSLSLHFVLFQKEQNIQQNCLRLSFPPLLLLWFSLNFWCNKQQQTTNATTISCECMLSLCFS